ncbi:MAG: hypothetical protein GY711_19105 [bacterium]|nr:hypothetical protein [bacterium]
MTATQSVFARNSEGFRLNNATFPTSGITLELRSSLVVDQNSFAVEGAV